MIKFIWMNLEDSGTKEGTTYLDNILDATEHVLIGMILSNPDNGQSAYKLTWHLVLYFIGGIRAGSPFKPIMKPKRSYSVNRYLILIWAVLNETKVSSKVWVTL